MVPTFWNCPENYIFFRWIMTLRSNYFYKNLIHISYDCLYSVIFRYLPFRDYSLVVTKGLVKLNKAMSHATCAWSPKTDESQWSALTKCGPLVEEMANHSSIPILRTLWTVSKGKNLWHWKMNPQIRRCPICYWGREEGNY